MANAAFFQRWHLAAKATQEMEAASTFEELLEILRHRARAIAVSDGVAVVRRDRDDVVYVGEEAIAPLWTGRRFKIESCVSGLAILQRRAIAIPDIEADDRVPLNAYLSTFVRSMAVFPIGAGAPLAALGCYWAETHAIDDDVMHLVGSLTMSANASLERLKVVEERRSLNASYRGGSGWTGR